MSEEGLVELVEGVIPDQSTSNGEQSLLEDQLVAAAQQTEGDMVTDTAQQSPGEDENSVIVLEESSAPTNRRKSTRARKAPKPVDSETTVMKEKRKYTKKRKSEAIIADIPIPQSVQKKAKKTITPSPKIVDPEGPVDVPPIEIGEGQLVDPTPTREKKPQKKWRPADVPPIECLVFWSKKVSCKIKTPIKPDIIVSEIADVPPSPLLDSEVQLPVPVIEAIPLDDPATPDSPRKSKKQIQEEIFKKSQPSVLRFFAATKQTELGIEDSRSSSASKRSGKAPDRPDLALYMQVWKESKLAAKKRLKNRKIFLLKSRNEPVKVLDIAELPRSEKYGVGKPLARPRPIYIAIHDRERPPVKLIMTHMSLNVCRRRPLAQDTVIDYEKDSDEEYEEEKEGEDLNSNPADAEEEAENEEGSEADSFFVSDGHFSDADELSDDEAVVARRRRQEMQVDSQGKATLQLVTFGPADLENLDTADCSENETSASVKWFKLLRDEAGINIFDPSSYFRIDTGEDEKKQPVKVEKPVVDWVPIRPELAKFVHGKASNVDSLCAEFKAMRPELSANAIKTEIRTMAAWTKRPEINSRVAWYVKPELMDSLGLTEDEMLALAMERRIVKDLPIVAVNKENQPAPGTHAGQQSILQFKPPPPSENVEEREPIRN